VSSAGTYYFRAQSAQGCWGTQGSATITVNALPTTVTVSGGGAICSGSSTTLTASNGSSGTIYWQNTTSSGTSTATASSSQSVSSAGTYYFRAQSAQGCWGTQGSATITVNALPTTVTVTGGGAICSGSSTTLTASNGSSGTIYWQNTTSSGTSTATASSSQSVSSAGTYYFRAQSAQGCWGTEGSATITVNALPTTVTVTGGGAICSGSSTTLTASNGSSGTIYWQNTTSSGTSTATASSSQSVSSAGTYYFRAQSAQGCWGTQGSATISVNALPTTVTVTGGGAICSGSSTTLTASNGSSGTIYWQNTTSSGTSTATASSSQSVSSAGTYYFRAQSAQGCWGTEGSATITVNALPTTVTVTGGGAICLGSSTTLTASNGSSGTIYWQNTTSSGTSTATASSSQSVSSAGTYFFRAQSAQGCWGTQGSATITVTALPTITSTTGAARGVTAKASIQATSSAGTINWYTASSGGSVVGTTNSAVAWTTPSISATTTYYAEAISGGCVSASRTAVIATVNDGLVIIGKENSSSFLQKQTNNSTDSLRVFVSTYALDNASNNGTIANDVSFIAISHNGGKLKATNTSRNEKPSGIYSRFEREWQVTNTNFNDNFSLEIEWLNAGNVNLSDLRLLVDTDGDFSNATSYSAADGLTFEIGSIIVRGINTTMIPSGTTRFITIGSVSSSTPLPVDLLSFTAHLNENTVEVNWETAIEVNNDYFILEKSFDGINWSIASKIKGVGNTNNTSNYIWFDNANFNGICYYKLSQYDINGQFETFKIVSVINNIYNDFNKYTLYPNPSSDDFILEFVSENLDDLKVKVFAENGQEVYQNKFSVIKGNNLIRISLDNLSKGGYLLEIENSFGLKDTKRLIKN
jgi:hypothetical protein